MVYGHSQMQHSDFTSELIPAESDITYELYVISCLAHQSWTSNFTHDAPDIEPGASL